MEQKIDGGLFAEKLSRFRESLLRVGDVQGARAIFYAMKWLEEDACDPTARASHQCKDECASDD